MQLMKKINKEFDERCIKIRNRIQRIKKEEENYQKKDKSSNKEDNEKEEEEDKDNKNIKKINEENENSRSKTDSFENNKGECKLNNSNGAEIGEEEPEEANDESACCKM